MSNRRYATFGEQAVMFEHIKRHLKKTDNGWQYEGDWSDDKVAKLANAELGITHLNGNHAASLRRTEFGQITKRNTREDRLSALEGVLHELVDRVRDLENRLGDLEDRFTAPEITRE